MFEALCWESVKFFRRALVNFGHGTLKLLATATIGAGFEVLFRHERGEFLGQSQRNQLIE